MAGISTDRINNYNDKDNIMAGFAMYEDYCGARATEARINESTVRLFRTFIQIGLFDNPYLSEEESTANVASADKVKAGFMAQLKSMVLLKNASGIIKTIRKAKINRRFIFLLFTRRRPLRERKAGQAPSTLI